MTENDTSGSGPWLRFLVAALVVVVGVIGYLLSRGDIFGAAPRPVVDAPRLLPGPLPDPPPLPRPLPAGRS